MSAQPALIRRAGIECIRPALPSSSAKRAAPRLCGEPRDLVVASDVRINKPEYAPLMECLVSEGFIRRYVNPDNYQEQIIATTTYVGTGATLDTIRPQQADEWYNGYDS